MKINQRDLFIVPFPFSDFSGRKVRPVIVISNNEFNHKSEDVIVCGITSNIINNMYSVIIQNSDLEEGRLIIESAIKAENILKINKKILIKKIGALKKEVFTEAVEKIYSIIS
ncbi:type II toxin-antitoxin system PemK/MazF family toxin [Candidatus Woesearchaeota archaeon]|nr:type II toxin-antitoxin system PemK/MazF family toxin [Candidatus Woesearchaeota archaeon]MBD3283320.1 type II toxin-antitoxin system PemK/MazF family toxin [Candidatus Pacearchaeota archaeon]